LRADVTDRRQTARPGRRWYEDPDLKGSFDRLATRISHDLHALRERQGWSIDALAKVAGVSADTVLAVEQTRTDPQLSTLIRLLYPFGYELAVGLRPSSPGYNRANPALLSSS
jgi:DNA-binding XRE family transcriptional regulator